MNPEECMSKILRNFTLYYIDIAKNTIFFEKTGYLGV